MKKYRKIKQLKRLIEEGIQEAEYNYFDNYYNELVWQVEMLQAMFCNRLEKEDKTGNYKCTCVLPEILNSNELLELKDRLKGNK